MFDRYTTGPRREDAPDGHRGGVHKEYRTPLRAVKRWTVTPTGRYTALRRGEPRATSNSSRPVADRRTQTNNPAHSAPSAGGRRPGYARAARKRARRYHARRYHGRGAGSNA